jgi:dTDP-4-dehydrorhamnose 3,5-epimerase
VYVVEAERVNDDRGFFARSWSASDFAEQGLDPTVVQCNISFNHRIATLRGMHYQAAPHEETKLVRCTHGAIFDVVVDIRPDSPTFMKWAGYELTHDNHLALFLPKGVAHGFQTLQPDTEVFYQMGALYVPEAARGFCWNDPAFDINWPLPDPYMSTRDRGYPRFEL